MLRAAFPYPVSNLSDIWNDGTTTFTGLKLNITDTASAAASLLMDLQIGGVSKEKTDKSGNKTLAGSLTLTDAVLNRDAANMLAQRNGTAAQEFRLYNTFTDASNYERSVLRWNANIFELFTAAAGTGTVRTIRFGSGSSQWQITTANHITPLGDNAVDLGATSTRVRNLFAVTLGSAAAGINKLYVDYTNTGTVGAVTINKAAGRVNIAASGASVVVTNSVVTAASKVFAVVSQNDGTAYIKNVVPAAGSFTITLGAAATSQVSIDFFVVNSD